MNRIQKRLRRERQTIQLMIGIYCRGRHRRSKSLCAPCQQLADYAMQRVDKCRFQKAKPTCVKCPVHCYTPIMRAQVREVMRYAGPRMMLHHPLLTVLHALDEMACRRGVLLENKTKKSLKEHSNEAASPKRLSRKISLMR